MARPSAIISALKAAPGRNGYAPHSGGMSRISPALSEMMMPGGSYSAAYSQFLPRPSQLFTDGAFAPASPIYPTPVDEPTHPGGLPGPRWWQPRVGWNLPTPPGTEGLKLAGFDTLRTLSEKYSVARACIEIRIEEIRALEWDITLTTDAAKAYQGDYQAMRDFGERKAQAKKFFRHPDPDFWNFDTFLNAFLEEIFVYDALSLVFRPKFGAAFGMGGKGLLGSNLDSMRLVSGPTIRPLVDLHGGTPLPPAPAFQQFLFGVPRSDYMTIATGQDLEASGLADEEFLLFGSDIMLYAPYWRSRESPYGFPPVERALLPIISGLQKQEYQLDYYTEGTVPAVYISPGDPNISPTQIGELQNALNALAGDPAYHLKVVVLPPGSKVEPQRPVDLSDSFDYLVMNQVLMAFDVQPSELGIIPDIGATQAGPGASSVRFAGQQKRDIKSRVSAKPLLKWVCDVFNYVLHDICQQRDMQFQFEGLVDDEDKAAITELGVQQIQNGMATIDEVRERLDLPPFGIKETSEPILFTPTGAVPLSMSEELTRAAIEGKTTGQGTNSGKSGGKSKPQVKVRRSGTINPTTGSHPAPASPHREPVGTPLHAAAAGTVQQSTPRTGGSAARNPVAGSRKTNVTPSRRTISGKAAAAELDALKRHLRKGRLISTWEPVNITEKMLSMISEDIAKGVLLDVAADRALAVALKSSDDERRLFAEEEPRLGWVSGDDSGDTDYDNNSGSKGGDSKSDSEDQEDDGGNNEDDEQENGKKFVKHASDLIKVRQFPGWEHDLGLVGRYKQEISQAFADAEREGSQLRKKAATGEMYVPAAVLRGLVSDKVREVFTDVMTPMWTKAWNIGYESATALVTGDEPDFEREHAGDHLQGFLGTEGNHWLEQVARTGLGNSKARSEIIARTEVARAVNAAAVQCYRDNGVQYKHLLVSPDDTCDICVNAKSMGIIPLDSIFPDGGLGGPFHPQCRCVPAPAGIAVEPPQAHIGKRDKAAEDHSRLAWLLLRAKDEDGKYRFLLQQRSEGTWGMPGGTPHIGEDSWKAAVRETTEEIGDLPELKPARTFHHVEGDGKTQVYLYMCDVPYFQPKMNGSTPEETQGAAWFRRKEIGKLNLVDKFRDDWEKGVCLEENVTKALDRNETGMVLTPEDNARGGGSRWPYPHRGDATEMHPGDIVRPVPRNNRPGGGQAPGEMGATEPPRDFNPQESEDPQGSDDGSMPERRGVPPRPKKMPSQDEHDDMYPQGHIASGQSPATSVGGGKVKYPDFVTLTIPLKAKDE